MHALGCLFFFLVGIFFLVFNAVRNIYDAAFGRRPQKLGGWQNTSYNRTNTSQGGSQGGRGGNSRQRRRKIFEDNEGEYVDFVEVRD